jgi:hypothetical protein
MVADNPDELITLKTFHARIVNDPVALKKEKDGYLPLPPVREVNQAAIQANYRQIKQDVQDIADSVMAMILNDSAKEHLLVKK